MEKYQELVDKCKQAYENNNLKLAYKYWCDIFDTTLDELDKCGRDDDIKTYKIWSKHNEYLKQFTNEQVYAITDFGKMLAYREMGYY